jgi:hypothetical protein
MIAMIGGDEELRGRARDSPASTMTLQGRLLIVTRWQYLLNHLPFVYKIFKSEKSSALFVVLGNGKRGHANGSGSRKIEVACRAQHQPKEPRM